MPHSTATVLQYPTCCFFSFNYQRSIIWHSIKSPSKKLINVAGSLHLKLNFKEFFHTLIIQFYFHYSLVTENKSVEVFCSPQRNLLCMFGISDNVLKYARTTHTCVYTIWSSQTSWQSLYFQREKTAIYWTPYNILHSTGIYILCVCIIWSLLWP